MSCPLPIGRSLIFVEHALEGTVSVGAQGGAGDPANLDDAELRVNEDAPWDTWSWEQPLGRMLSGVVGLGALGAALVVGGGARPGFWAGLIGPDVALVPAVLRMRGAATGGGPALALKPDEVTLYNTLHGIRGPVVTLAVAAVGSSHGMLVTGLGWLAHVGIDRAFGYGKRLKDGRIASTRPVDAHDEG
jgi:hypothetical protein